MLSLTVLFISLISGPSVPLGRWITEELIQETHPQEWEDRPPGAFSLPSIHSPGGISFPTPSWESSGPQRMNLMRGVEDSRHDKAPQLIASHSGHKKPFEISVKMIVDKRHERKLLFYVGMKKNRSPNKSPLSATMPKPEGSMSDMEMLNFALSTMPWGRSNSPDMVTFLGNHPNELRWPNPNEEELRGYINNALYRAQRSDPPMVIAHKPRFPSTLQEYTLSHETEPRCIIS